MIQHRCPWCGEKIPIHLQLGPLIWLGPDVCPKCKRPYTSNSCWSSIIILLTGMVGEYIIIFFTKKFRNNNVILYWLLGIAGLIILALLFIELFRIPYARDIKKKERRYINPKRTADVNLSWKKHKKKGLLLPRLQVLNGEIFAACFLGADGTPISTAFCVVLNDFLWLDNYHCTCKVYFVLDDAPEEELFRKGNQFYFYYDYRKIAAGTIL